MKIPRIGYLIGGTNSGNHEAFRQGLRELGYAEGKNIIIVEARYTDARPERLADITAELVGRKVDIIVAGGGQSIRAAQKATKTIPIVMMAVSDAVMLGFVDSLARPGGNITGLTTQAPELGGKRLELLKEIVPKLSSVAVLGDRNSPGYGPQKKEIEVAAPALGLKLQIVEPGPDELETAFSTITKARAGALIVLQGPLTGSYRKQIVDLAAKSRLVTTYHESGFVEIGGLMSYGTNVFDLYRRAAIYVDKILKGAKPADLPVEQPKKFELIINLKAAKQIGLTIPPNVLA
ncbi:MAG TPA: ABC transporter substrate-binding protein, partial [Candidatus Binatia bacterium]|nr:ABC transporter substrate-binding protein [Candidatus Binatia bacterium]